MLPRESARRGLARCVTAAMVAASGCGPPAVRPTAPMPGPAATTTEAPSGASVLRMTGPWTGEPQFAGAVLPWMVGITILPCRVTDFDGSGEVSRTRTLTYDADARLVRVSSEEGDGERVEDAVFCLPSGWTDAELSYDESGLRCVTPEVEAPPTCYERDAAGLTGWRDGVGTRATLHRDARGRVSRVDGSFWGGEGVETWTMRYDAAGRLARMQIDTEEEERSEVIYEYAYDARGNLAELARTGRSRFAPDGEALTVLLQRTRFAYDDAGRLAECDHDAGTVTYEYDAEGRLESRTATAPSGQILAQTVFEYECDGE